MCTRLSAAPPVAHVGSEYSLNPTARGHRRKPAVKEPERHAESGTPQCASKDLLKTGPSYLVEPNEDGYVYRGALKHLNYWKEHSLPVLILLCDPTTRTCYWEHIAASNVTRTPKGWKITVPRAKTLTVEHKEALAKITEPPQPVDYIELALYKLLMEKFQHMVIAQELETPHDFWGFELWFSQTSKLLINWGLTFLFLFRCPPPLVALAAAFMAFFRDRAALQLEILALRHQLGVLQRSVKRPKLTAADRFLWARLSTVWKEWQSTIAIVKPATVIGWHRQGFRLFWTWRIRRGKPGRPGVPKEIRSLIRKMSRDNPLWGAPRIHGELLKLGMDIGETSVSKYMIRQRNPPSQTWRTFLDNHVKTMVSVDFFTVPTLRFQVLYVFLVLAHDRRRILHVGVTAHPTAEWTAQQLREAFPWDTAPRYLLRDRDRIFGTEVVNQLRDLEIKEVLSAPRSPWQRAYVERVIGTIRREYLDHVIVFNDRSLYRHLQGFMDYYHRSRTHLGLEKDTPVPRPIQSADMGQIFTLPEVGGLHHRYERRAA